jgi:hypothetical protein
MLMALVEFVELVAVESIMNDVVAIALFAGCLLATYGLVWLCERLSPLQQRGRTGTNAHEEVKS